MNKCQTNVKHFLPKIQIFVILIYEYFYKLIPIKYRKNGILTIDKNYYQLIRIKSQTRL